MPSLYDVPTKSEVYSIASRKLTHEELMMAAHEAVRDAAIFHEDPREWPSYQAFLGHQMSKVMLYYQIGQGDLEQLDEFVRLVKDRMEG